MGCWVFFVSTAYTQVLPHKLGMSGIMGSFSKEELEFTFLDEGFTAKDILDQKINEVSSSVSMPRKGLHFMTLQVSKLGEQTASGFSARQPPSQVLTQLILLSVVCNFNLCVCSRMIKMPSMLLTSGIL